MCFDPCNCSLKIWKSIEIPTPKVGTHFRTWKFIPLHSPTLPRAWDVTPGLPFWPTPLQALTLVTSLRLGLQQFVFNLHLKKLHSFNNPKKHLEQKTSWSYSLFLSTPFVMSFTPFVNNDVDLSWSKDGSNIYFKLFDFSIFFQIYVEANHVNDATNVKPSNGENVVDTKAFNVIIILFP